MAHSEIQGYTPAMQALEKPNFHYPPERPPTDLAIRAVILEKEREILAVPKEQFVGKEDVAVHHYFAEGTYTRRMIIPAGILLTGAIHKHDTTNIITRGHVRVLTETEGGKDIIGPATFIGPKWTKRLIWVLEEVEWITVHPDPGTRDEDELRAWIAWDRYEDVDPDIKELLA